MRFGVALSASIAPKTLQSITVFAESLTINKTAMAGHLDLDLSPGQSQNERGAKSLVSGHNLGQSPVGGTSHQQGQIISASRLQLLRPDSFVISNPRYSGLCVVNPFSLLECFDPLGNPFERRMNDGERILLLHLNSAITKCVLNTGSSHRFGFFHQNPVAAFLNAEVRDVSPERVQLFLSSCSCSS